jgi:hypothetical protein
MPGEEERRWEQHDREHSTAEHSHQREHESEEKAINLAVVGMERRLDELNQLRKEVVLDRSQFLTISTWDAEHKALKVEMRTKHEALDGRIDALEKVIDHFEGAVNTWRGIAAFLGISGVGAVIYAIVQSRP